MKYWTYPVLYFVLPLFILLLLGANFREIGLGRGYHGWRVALLWSFLPLTGLAVFLALGVVSPASILKRAASNFFQNGFFEEFLFRGALMTRLCYLFRNDWGLVLSTMPSRIVCKEEPSQRGSSLLKKAKVEAVAENPMANRERTW